MPRKKKDIQLRRAVEKELFALGASQADVSRIFRIPDSSVTADIQMIGKENIASPSFGSTPAEHAAESYRKALRKYAELYLLKKTERGTSLNALFDALGRHIEATSRLRDVASVIIGMMDLLRNRVKFPEWFGYQLLLDAIFEIKTKVRTPEELLEDYLWDIYLEAIETPSNKTIASSMMRWSLTRFQSQLFRPTLNEVGVKMINEAFMTHLTARERTILRLRYSLGCEDPPVAVGAEKWTENECAAHYAVSRGLIVQSCAGSLRKLRATRQRLNGLSLWVAPAETTIQRWLAENTLR